MTLKDFYPLTENDLLDIGIEIEEHGLMAGMSLMNDKLGFLLPLPQRTNLIKQIRDFIFEEPNKKVLKPGLN